MHSNLLMDPLPREMDALRTAIEAMPVAVSWASLADQRILFTNCKFSELFGYGLGDFASISDWVERAYPYAEDRELVAQTWGRHLANSESKRLEIESIEIRVLCRDGSEKTILNSGILLPEAGWALATFVDITDRKQHELRMEAAERRAAENEAIYRLLLDHSQEMIILAPFDESRRYVSGASLRITGFTAEEFLALKPLNMFHPQDRGIAEQVLKELRAGKLEHQFRYRMLRKGGEYRWVEAKVTGYCEPSTGETIGYVATVRDIADQLEREERLAQDNRAISEVAALDELTGIANRRTFNMALGMEVSRLTRNSHDLSLLMIDVDFFKKYNDLYGHLAGDACLRRIAGTIRDCVRRGTDLVARFGGEEFVALLPMTNAAGGAQLATKILQGIAGLAMPHLDSPHGVVTISIGVSSWPAGSPLEPELLMERADRALYQAKERGRNTFAIG